MEERRRGGGAEDGDREIDEAVEREKWREKKVVKWRGARNEEYRAASMS